jgi:hypothetical protein
LSSVYHNTTWAIYNGGIYYIAPLSLVAGLRPVSTTTPPGQYNGGFFPKRALVLASWTLSSVYHNTTWAIHHSGFYYFMPVTPPEQSRGTVLFSRDFVNPRVYWGAYQ